jgi:hypothetical protein
LIAALPENGETTVEFAKLMNAGQEIALSRHELINQSMLAFVQTGKYVIPNLENATNGQ